MAQHCRLAEARRDRWRICVQGLESVYRGEASDLKLGGPAERREEVPDGDRGSRPRTTGLRENGNSKQGHATSGEQREPDDAGSGEITDEDIPF